MTVNISHGIHSEFWFVLLRKIPILILLSLKIVSYTKVILFWRVWGNEKIRKEIAYECDYIIKQVATMNVRTHLPS